jgi:AraC-like DNA-binding protein
MYSIRIIDSNDPDRYAASIRPIASDFTVTGRGAFHARSILFDLGRVYAHRGCERLARIKHADVPRPGVMFLTEPGPSVFFNGAEIGINQIAIAGAGESYISRSSGATRWGAMTLAKDDMDALCMIEPGSGTHRVSGVTVITPPPASLAHLRSLHNYMGRLAETIPEVLTDTELAHGLEHSLIVAMRGLLGTDVEHPNSIRMQHHQFVIHRFLELIRAQPPEPLPIANIGRQLRVSGRTLRGVCREILGVSPRQYVMLRRMQMARCALRKADPAVVRVTDIATEHGFWELGRFSVNYRQLFDESPKTTLKGDDVQCRPIRRTNDQVCASTYRPGHRGINNEGII